MSAKVGLHIILYWSEKQDTVLQVQDIFAVFRTAMEIVRHHKYGYATFPVQRFKYGVELMCDDRIKCSYGFVE